MSVPTTRFAGAITFGLLAICLTAVCKPTACRADEVDQIDISYVEPESDELRPAYLELKKRGVLEQLQTFLSPLKLPRRLLVQAKQCGSNGGAYAPGGAVIICYEDVSRIEQTLPEEAEILVGPGALTGENRGRLKREDLIVAPVIMVALQKAALALFDILDVPVWGNADEAANRLAGYLMTQFGDQIAWKTLMGSAWYLAQTTMTGAGADFYYVRDPEARRFYGILCMAYASDPKTFGFLARNLDIPSRRIDKCIEDFVRVQQAFDATILPHVDHLAAEGAGNVVASPRPAPVTSILRNLGRPMRGSREMSAVKIALGLTLALAVAVFPAVPALADDFRPNRVVVDYIEPRSDSLQGVYERMKKSGVLEELARFMAPMRLPTTLRIWAIECYEDAELMAYYSAQEHAIHFCYEFVDRLEKSRPADVTEEGFVPAQVFLGAMVGLLLHETGHAFVDLFKVPVFGREEDAADQIAEFIALQFDKDLAETVTKGAGWLWLTDARTMLYLDYYAEVHSTSMERFLNYLCLGYGNEPDRFMDLADKFLKARARRCTDEYQQVEKAFTKTVLPYVDPSMLQEVRARRWFAPSMYEWR